MTITRKNKTLPVSTIVFLFLIIFFNDIYCLNNHTFLNYKSDIVNSTINNPKINDEIKYSEIHNSIISILIRSLEKELSINNFTELRERVELHTWLWREMFGEGPYNFDSFKNSLFLNQIPKYLTGYKRVLTTLHQNLYSWLYNNKFFSLNDLFNSFDGRGIVICTNDNNFKYTLSTIDILRNIINTNIPIEIFYNGEDDLSEKYKNEFLEYSDVYISDISKYFDNDILNINELSIKPFAILASRFKEVILINSDIIYIRDPYILFEEEGYKKTGTIFFRDRTLFPGPHVGSQWIKSWIINPLPETKNLRFWNEESAHEIETSTVVIDKGKVILGLLAVCKFNEKHIRDEILYKKIYEEKETFWIGFDMAREHYNEISKPIIQVGEELIGESDNSNVRQLWGYQGHINSDSRVLYWDEYIMKNKNDNKFNDRLLKFDGYIIENTKTNWVSSKCININDQEVHYFNDEEKDIIDKIISRKKEIDLNLSKKFVIKKQYNITEIKNTINNNYSYKYTNYIELNNEKIKIIEKNSTNFDKNILYISRHDGTISNFNNIAYKLGFNITVLKPTYDYIEKPNCFEKDECKSFVKYICSKYDYIVVGDVIPDSYIFLTNPCGAKIVLEITQRFDYVMWFEEKNKKDYLENFSKAIMKNNIAIVENNPFEVYYACQKKVFIPKYYLIRPFGYAPPELMNEIHNEIHNEIAFVNYQIQDKEIILPNLKNIGIKYTVLPRRYGGPLVLATYKGILMLPYEVSVMKMMENFRYGVAMILPSERLFKELIKGNNYNFSHKELNNIENGISNYVEFYNKEFNDLFVYFDKWEDLSDIIANTDFDKLKLKGKKFISQYEERALNIWAQALDNVPSNDIIIDEKPLCDNIEFYNYEL